MSGLLALGLAAQGTDGPLKVLALISLGLVALLGFLNNLCCYSTRLSDHQTTEDYWNPSGKAKCWVLEARAMVKSAKGRQVCVYCGSDGPLTTEHVVPISRWREFGVKRRILDNPSNRVLACARCNAEKGSMSPKRWLDLHPEYREHFIREAKYLSDAVKEIAGIA